MKTFQKQLSDQLDFAPGADGIDLTLSFFGCSINEGDVLLLQSERLDLRGLRELEFAHCRFKEPNKTTPLLAQLLVSLNLQSLSLVDNLHCSVADISKLILHSGAKKVRVRDSLSMGPDEDISGIHPLEVLLSACTKVRNLRLYLPTRQNQEADGREGRRTVSPSNQVPPFPLDNLTKCIRQYLSNLQYLMWNGLGATNLQNVADWCALVEEGFLCLKSLKALWLENFLIMEDPASAKEEQPAKTVLTKLVHHVSEELTLVHLSPCICSGISQCLEGASLQELNLHRIRLLATELRYLIKTTLSSQACDLCHLGLRQIGIQGDAKHIWNDFCDSLRAWSHLKSLDISGIHSSNANQPIQPPPDSARIVAAMHDNTQLTAFYLNVEGCRTVLLPFHLAERNFQLSRAEKWLKDYYYFEPSTTSCLAKRRDERSHQAHWYVDHNFEEDIQHQDSLWPVMLQSLNKQPAALQRLVMSCAATDWAHFDRLNRKRKPRVDLK